MGSENNFKKGASCSYLPKLKILQEFLKKNVVRYGTDSFQFVELDEATITFYGTDKFTVFLLTVAYYLAPK